MLSGGELVAIAAAVLVAAAVQVTAGFGFALLAVPLMASVVDPKLAVVVSTGLGILTSSGQAVLERRHLQRPIAGRMLAGAILAMPVGLAIFVTLDVELLRIALAVAVLIAVVLLARGLDLRHVGPGLDWAAGFVSGILATTLSTNGPPLVFTLQARHLDPSRFRATITAVLAVTGVIALGLFAAAGRVDATAGEGILVAVPALAVGSLIGLGLRRHVTPERFRVIVLVLLTLAAVSSFVAAVRG